MELNIDKISAMADQAIHISVANVKPGAKIQIRIEAQDANRQLWLSSAFFEADEHGRIDLERDAPLSGDYKGVDAMGLFWSMRPQRGAIERNIFAVRGLSPLSMRVRVRENDAIMAEKTLERHFVADGVSMQEIDNDQVTGILFKPEGDGPFPAIALIPGSGGVLASSTRAALLASKGYAVLIVGYCEYKSLPKAMYDIALETIAKGIRYLAKQPFVDAEKLTAMGISKGAEGLLACTSYIPDLPMNKMILITPSSVVWQGIGKGRPQKRSTWSLNDQPLPYLLPNQGEMFRQAMRSIFVKKSRLGRLFERAKVARFAKGYQKALSEREAAAAALIPAGNVKVPALLISGGEDELWPSLEMANQISDMMLENSDVHHVCIPEMGHIVYNGYLPMTVNYCSFSDLTLGMGGSASGNAKGFRISQQHITAFLGE